MEKGLENVLLNLQPDIHNKCEEIKRKKVEKKLQILFCITALLFLFVPSLLIILNISLIYMVISVILILSLSLFILLPNFLRDNNKVKKGNVCYE